MTNDKTVGDEKVIDVIHDFCVYVTPSPYTNNITALYNMHRNTGKQHRISI